ncbi:hypothetical protein BBP40_009324 [Aspergillus hancockii]|nr:hypothetical protein BBP40_009324 [Aspergillus hancockii]
MSSISLESNLSYTVGWIAALSNERAAAMEMLQVHHKKPREFNKAHNDPNAYSWGSIGEHNIVIASLPAGVYGKVSATTTASYMLASFPNIRIGLMVGIGAGIGAYMPDNKDIRLGDVAVSQPDGTSGGVIQYDLGKLGPNGTFQRKGSLNAPPTALLSALGLIQAEHKRRRHYITKYVDDMLERNPFMREPDEDEDMPYSRPDPATDKLFLESYEHFGAKDCSGCNTRYLVQRNNRRTTAPRIFYGVIASGDKLIKDPAARKAVVEDAGEECICIEMEAAGLMNSFPCLVIRGICDYADTHKNDLWHNYAAATAAAYARELLEMIEVGDVEKTPRAKERIQDPQPTPLPTLPDPNGNLNNELDTLRKDVQKLAHELEKVKLTKEQGNSANPRIECGHAVIKRKQDGSGTKVTFKQPFSRNPVVTLTARMDYLEPYYGQRIYLLQEPSTPVSTPTYFIAGCWGGGKDGGAWQGETSKVTTGIELLVFTDAEPLSFNAMPGNQEILNRPLTPLSRCLEAGLPADNKQTAAGACTYRASHNPNDNLGAEITIHAKVYCFAHHFCIHELEVFALQRLTKVLLIIDEETEAVFPYLADAIRVVYSSTPGADLQDNPARKLLSQYVALNYTTFESESFDRLMAEGGDFMVDLSHKLARRLDMNGIGAQSLEEQVDQLQLKINELDLGLQEQGSQLQRAMDELGEWESWNRGISGKYKKAKRKVQPGIVYA